MFSGFKSLQRKQNQRFRHKRWHERERVSVWRQMLTCRRWILCANVRAHSRSEQRRTGPCPSRSPVCPCCRCETSGLRRSWWSAPDTERLWSRTRTLNSPEGARRTSSKSTSKPEEEIVFCTFTHNKSTVDLLQNQLLVEGHGLSFPLLYSLLLQFFACVHLPRCSDLARTHLELKE